VVYSAEFTCRSCGNEIKMSSVNPITDTLCAPCAMAIRYRDTAQLARNKAAAAESKRNRQLNERNSSDDV
jgi:phage-related baseplate assembly protein